MSDSLFSAPHPLIPFRSVGSFTFSEAESRYGAADSRELRARVDQATLGGMCRTPPAKHVLRVTSFDDMPPPLFVTLPRDTSLHG